LHLYDEPIIEKTLEFAGKVWHLKDKLARYARETGVAVDIDEYVNRHQPLTIVADLSNANKHGENRNRSGLGPHIEMVRFDTSNCGGIEMFLDGATHDKEIIVSNKLPIPFTVDLNTAGGAVFGDAVQIIFDALRAWLPLIEQLRLLSADNRPVRHLRERLKLPSLKP
jgi:hypothetical protein